MIAAVVLHWNLPEPCLRCVESLMASREPVRVTVVDNGSRREDLRALREGLAGRPVRLLELGRNTGFARGMNAGIEAAVADGAEAVLILNDDAMVEPEAVAEMAAVLRHRPRAWVVGPVILEGNRLWRYADFEVPWLPFPRRGRRVPAGPVRVDYVTGCAMLLRAEAAVALQGFDPAFFLHYEDADLCRRARERGGEVWCAPAAVVRHAPSSSAAPESPLVRYCRSWGRVRFYRRHPHGPVPGLSLVYAVLANLGRAAADLLRGRASGAAAGLRGTLDALRGRPGQVEPG